MWAVVLLALFIGYSEQYAFESCTDDNAKPFGNCTVRQKDGAIGSESVNTVVIRNGYLDMGPQGGCPFVNNSCQRGFSFYGWMKLFEYPKACDNFAVYVSTGQFNIHVLGNGHLAAYVWMANDTEWYVESLQPILLNIYYPIVLQFYYYGSKNGSLQLIMQDQLSGISNCSQFRTYKPPKPNLLFAGDGVSTDHSAYVELDRTHVSNPVSSLRDAIGTLIDPPARQAACSKKPHSILTRSFQCFWVQDKPLNWSSAYTACNSSIYDDGYPYGRLARLPEDNETIWQLVAKNLPQAKSYWLGGGKQLHWMNANMQIVDNAHVPKGVKWSPGNGCLVVNTKASPLMWTEVPCTSSLPAVCEMSWDCLLHNPCKNLGACIPVTDGPTCQCFSGTSGKYCEQSSGIPRPSCVNNCPCPLPQQCPVVLPPQQQTQASETTYLNNQNQCYTTQIVSLKATMTVYHISYDLQWEVQIRERFTVIWTKWHPASLIADDNEWKLCLTVALNIKIMVHYRMLILEQQVSVKLKIDQCSSDTILLVNIVRKLKTRYSKQELVEWGEFFEDIDDLIVFS